MQYSRVGLLAASLFAAASTAATAVAVTRQPPQPGQPGQSGQPGHAGQPGQPGEPGQPGQPGQSGSTAIAIGSSGSSGGSGNLEVIQSQGVTRISASCDSGSGNVDFGDGTSAKISDATGPIRHTYASAGSHRVTLTCLGAHGHSASTSTATVGTPSGGSKARCRPAGSNAIADVLDRLLVRLGFAICRR